MGTMVVSLFALTSLKLAHQRSPQALEPSACNGPPTATIRASATVTLRTWRRNWINLPNEERALWRQGHHKAKTHILLLSTRMKQIEKMCSSSLERFERRAQSACSALIHDNTLEHAAPDSVFLAIDFEGDGTPKGVSELGLARLKLGESSTHPKQGVQNLETTECRRKELPFRYTSLQRAQFPSNRERRQFLPLSEHLQSKIRFTAGMHLPQLHPAHLHRIQSQSPTVYGLTLLLTLVPLYILSYTYRLHHPYGTSSASSNIRPPSTNVTSDWLATSLVQPYNPSPLRTYCAKTTWRSNSIFNLADANGGIGNVRGNILDFVFYAIEAGASMYLPGMAGRAEADLSNVWGSKEQMGHMFDEVWFLEKMKEACPQMKILREGEEIEATELQGNYLPRTRRMDDGYENTRQAYLADLEMWMSEKEGFEKDGSALMKVNFERTLWNFDTRSLPLGLRRNFGQLLRVRSDVRSLAAGVVKNLKETYDLPIDPRDAVPKGAFYGAHLRIEADAANAGWLSEPAANFTVQTDAYLSQAVKHGLRVVYAASGDVDGLKRFKEKGLAWHPAVRVITKQDLMSEAEQTIMAGLTWDQHALIDWEVLRRCSVFGGFVKSSFSFNVAISRNQWLEDSGAMVEPYWVQDAENGVAFDDGLSRMLDRDGWHEQRIPRGMWP
ncbi:unnamed protein product [Zymoseptoria tritici ST99CH_1E4]|uniref:Alternative oxidase n=1 Tax=Zymoseptoria tritici ST99CH_1E4 TaxID=1276532 RepID=A0A2H1GCD5_ZYMTR|nr:unnamed protein product [Zymoseptoria tritici ST99CH_1E4]